MMDDDDDDDDDYIIVLSLFLIQKKIAVDILWQDMKI